MRARHSVRSAEIDVTGEVVHSCSGRRGVAGSEDIGIGRSSHITVVGGLSGVVNRSSGRGGRCVGCTGTRT